MSKTEQAEDKLISKIYIKESPCCESSKTRVISPSSRAYSDFEKETITSIRSSQQKVKKDLAEMIQDYKDEAQKMLNNHGWDPQKEAKIKDHLRRLKKEKEQRRAKFEQDLKRLQQKQEKVGQSNETSSKQKQQKRANIEKRISKIKERQQKREDQYKGFLKFYEEFKSRKPKYAVLEQQFKKKEQKQNTQKLLKYKQQLSEVYKPMDLNALQQFQQNYINQKYESQKQRLQHQLMEKKRQEVNKQKLQQLYRGHCHSVVLDELAQRAQKSNEARQRQKRIKQYGQIVRQEYRPRAKSGIQADYDESSIASSQMPQTQRGKRVVKDRYLKGQYIGKMVYFEKQSLSHQDQHHKGLQYLEYLRSLPKRSKKEEKTLEPLPSSLKPKPGVYRVPRPQNPLYRGSRRYSSIDTDFKSHDSSNVKRVLQFMKHRQSLVDQDQKLLKNRAYRNRTQWQVQQKSFNAELVNNIQEKLDILKKM